MNRRVLVRCVVIFLGLVLSVLSFEVGGAEQDVWLEAESFETLGGWVIDQQSMDQMGSAYVMAHGIGAPVADAQTECPIPESGQWTVWVRARDWTAPWKRGKPGGAFKVLINGRELPETLGTNGEKWAIAVEGTAGDAGAGSSRPCDLPPRRIRLVVHNRSGAAQEPHPIPLLSGETPSFIALLRTTRCKAA